MVESNREVRKYIKEIRKGIPCGGMQKKRVVERVKVSIREYVTKTPNPSYNDLLLRFGSPEEIAVSCVEEQEANELIHNLQIRRKIVMIIASLAFVIILVWGIVVACAYCENRSDNDGYIERIVSEDTATNCVDGVG